MMKAIVHINFADPERQQHGLGNVRNMISAALDPPEIEVVCHGPGISLLLRGHEERTRTVSDLLREGVRFVACENTLESQSISRAELIPGVDVVPSGAVEVIAKQQDGYGYFRP